MKVKLRHLMDNIFKFPALYGIRMFLINRVMGIPARMIASLDVAPEEQLEKFKNERVLDVGCGRGELCLRFSDYAGFDVSKEMIEHCRKNLAGYKCPTSVDWMAEIPRNPSGKILKVELRKPYWAGRERQVS